MSQSSSVFGTVSTTPLVVSMLLTALKMLSATGSSMSRISSLTETTAFMSPHSGGDAGGGADGGGDEQAADRPAKRQTENKSR